MGQIAYLAQSPPLVAALVLRLEFYPVTAVVLAEVHLTAQLAALVRQDKVMLAVMQEATQAVYMQQAAEAEQLLQGTLEM
jgi:hypothetical protein